MNCFRVTFSSVRCYVTNNSRRYLFLHIFSCFESMPGFFVAIFLLEFEINNFTWTRV